MGLVQLKSTLSGGDVEGIGPLRGLALPIHQLRVAARHGLASGQPIELPALVAQLDLQKVVGCGKKAIEHQAGGLGIGQPEVFAMAQHQHGLFGRDQPFTSSGFVSQAQAVAPFALGLEGLGLARRQQKALAAVGTWRHTGWGRPQRRRYLEPQTIVGLGGRDCAGGRRRGWRLVF